MIQINEQFGTKRQVRRRPVFVSTADAQRARTNRNNRPGNNFKAVPGYWDKSMLPDTGYKTIPLQESSEEYQKILALFQKTMGGHSIHKVERVQNRALWEVFQWQQDLMRKNDAGRKVDERLLFHGTDSVHVDAICQQNFDWRLCGTHGTAYGKGSYFARDARYSHSYTSASGVRTMFVCRVLVGCYTRGDSSYLRPPSKDGGNSMFYDSCVDNTHDPSIFVVFEKHQVYPEYILKYGEDIWLSSAGAKGTVSSLGLNSTRSAHRASTVPTMTQNPKAQRPVSTSSVTPKPVQAPPPVSASSVTPKPVQTPPPVSASSLYPKPVQAPPPVSASSVTPKPVQAPPPVYASSVTPKPLKVPPPVRPRSVTLKPTQAPPPFTTSSLTSNLMRSSMRIKALVEMFDPYRGQSSDSTGTTSSPSDSDGTYSRTPTSASPPTSFPGDGYSPSAVTGTSSQSGSTKDSSLDAFIRSRLHPKT